MPKSSGHYTEKQMMSKFSLSRSRMYQLRNAWDDEKDGKTYHIDPILHKGTDWDYYDENGELYYTTSAIDKLTSEERKSRSDAHTGGAKKND